MLFVPPVLQGILMGQAMPVPRGLTIPRMGTTKAEG